MQTEFQSPLLTTPDDYQPLPRSVPLPISESDHADIPVTGSAVPLLAYGSIQMAGDELIDDESAALNAFLASLGMTQEQLESAEIPGAAFRQVYRQEFSRLSWWKWSSFDHLIEKQLQWPLLSHRDMGIRDLQRCEYRLRPQERSLLLNTTWGLVKAYAVRGWVQGVEVSLLESTHYFIYAMLAYRLAELLQTGYTQFNDFQDIFRSSSQKGIDSLVQSLAKIDATWLKLILAAPFLVGALQSFATMWSARPISAEERQDI